MQSLGQWLKSQRKAKNWRQEDVASAIRSSVRGVALIERDRVRPQHKTLQAIADVFGVSFDWLLKLSRGEHTEPAPHSPKPAGRVRLEVSRDVMRRLSEVAGAMGVEKWLEGFSTWILDQDDAVQMLMNKSVERYLTSKPTGHHPVRDGTPAEPKLALQ